MLKIVKKAKIYFAFFMVAVFVLFLSVNSGAKESPAKNVVKVAWYNEKNLNGVRNGNEYFGYEFDYFNELSKYTDLKFEFVQSDWKNFEGMLERGEIDVIPFILKNEEREKHFAFSDHSVISKYPCLTSVGDSAEYLFDCRDLQDKTVIIEKNTTYTNFIKNYIPKDIKFKTLEYDSLEEAYIALREGKGDYLMTTSFYRLHPNEYVVKRFPLINEYIAVKKDNTELLEKLQIGIENIKIISPDFETKLASKYLGKENFKKPLLSKEEHTYLENIDKLKVGFYGGKGYLCTVENGIASGIEVSIMENVCHMLGVKMEQVILNDNYLDEKDNVDIVSGFVYDYQKSEIANMYITFPYLIMNTYLVKGRRSSIDKNASIALSYDKNKENIKILSSIKNSNVKYFSNDKDCLDALCKSIVDATVINNFCYEYYLDNEKYRGLVCNFIDYPYEISLGIPKSKDRLLLSSVSKALSSISENDKNEVILYHITKPKGTISPIQFVKKNPITTFGVLGIIICLSLVMFYDKVIKEKDQKIDMAMHEASKDLMTGIYNRKFFEENVDADIKKEGGNLAMIMLDIDEFKSINDTYGHSFGDEVIKKVADILETFFGSESYAGRMGGDEFAVLIKDCKSENIILMRTEDLIKKINGCMENEYKYLKVKISAGIVMIDGSEKTFSDIYIMLDEALYDAKKSGKNKAILYKL